MRVWPLEELVDIIQDEEVFEYTDEMRRLIVHQVIYSLHF